MLNFDWLDNVSLEGARLFLIMAFMIALVFGMLTRKEYIFKGAKNFKKWRDFRIWIIILVVVQVILYSYF